MVLGFYKLIHIDIALDIVLLESLLKNLVVFDVFVVMLGSPLDLGHGNSPGVNGVDDLAVDGARRALLDLGQLQVEEIVDPSEQLSATHEEGDRKSVV